MCGLAPRSTDRYEEKNEPICFANGDSVCFIIVKLLRLLGKYTLKLLM